MFRNYISVLLNVKCLRATTNVLVVYRVQSEMEIEYGQLYVIKRYSTKVTVLIQGYYMELLTVQFNTRLLHGAKPHPNGYDVYTCS